MQSSSVTASWLSENVFLLKDHAGFPLVMTQPGGVNGADLLPLSLIGCAAWDVAAILKKQRQQITALDVSADCERDEQPPWQFRRIRIIYRLRGRGLAEDKVQRAVDLAEQKYCSVYVTLRLALEIEHEIHLTED